MRGLRLNVVIYTSLISAHTREGRLQEARRILESMKEQGIDYS
jgi:pentatricopeptide repeat protein